MSGSSQVRTVLFLISDTGAGHRSAANAIHQAMIALQGGNSPSNRPIGIQGDQIWRVLVVDAFDECGRFPLREGVFLYGPAIKYSPRLFGEMYRVTNTRDRFNLARLVCQPFLKQGLRRLFERARPDVIVSIHPLLNHVTLQVLDDMAVRIPVITIITDLVSVHCAWIAPAVDACVAPTDRARDVAIGNGMVPDRVHLLGFPINPRFADPCRRTRRQIRTDLHLHTDLPLVLVVGGGEGAGGLAEAASTLAAAALPVQVVAICGRNRQLEAQLRKLAPFANTRMHVEGFVNNMHDYMHAADLIVTKAGPGTISEAVACELPIVLTGAVPGQEEGNIAYVIENGLGQSAAKPTQVPQIVNELLSPQGATFMASYRHNARQLGYANAATEIARLILSYVPGPLAPSAWDRLRAQSPVPHQPGVGVSMVTNTQFWTYQPPRIGMNNASTGSTTQGTSSSYSHRPARRVAPFGRVQRVRRVAPRNKADG